MASKDTTHNIEIVQLSAPAVVAATANGGSADTEGYESVTVVFSAGAIVSSGNITPKLQDSDDNSTFADVTAANLIGSLPTALAAATAYRVGYIGNRRYVRSVLTLNSGTSVAVDAIAILGHPRNAPTA